VLSVGLFEEFLGGIPDVRRITGDDLRRFVGALRNRSTWAGCPERQKRPLSPTTINTYVRAIRALHRNARRITMTWIRGAEKYEEYKMHHSILVLLQL